MLQKCDYRRREKTWGIIHNKAKNKPGAQLIVIGMPTICIHNVEPNLIHIESKRQ